jgi:hypothetical protein
MTKASGDKLFQEVVGVVDFPKGVSIAENTLICNERICLRKENQSTTSRKPHDMS